MRLEDGNMANLVTVAGTPLKNPSTYNALTADIVDSGRNVKGYIVSDVIRADVAKVEMTWRYLTAAEWADILSLFNPNRGGAFINEVKYFDQGYNAYQTREMYIGDRSAGIALLDMSGNVKGFSDCKLSLIEV